MSEAPVKSSKPSKPSKPAKPANSLTNGSDKQVVASEQHSIPKETASHPATVSSKSNNTNLPRPSPPPPPPPPKIPSSKSTKERSTVVEIEESSNDLHKGILSKRNREGKFETCLFTVCKDAIFYHRISSTGNAEVDDAAVGKSISLATIVIRELEESDYEGCVKRLRAFRFLSNQKSFLVRAKTEEEKAIWFSTLEKAARDFRIANNLREPGDNELAPIWALDESKCQICQKSFTFFVRKHHCRNCGRCVCEPCSKEKIRIPRLDARQLFKVCSECAKYLKDNRKYGAPSEA